MRALVLAAALLVVAAPAASASSDVADGYHRLLLVHTRWQETTWDEAAGSYKLQDFDFAGVLGNAVVLRFGDYDASLAGVSRAELHDHTVRTIARFAASNRWVRSDGDWGGRIFWDATFESYFVAAAKLMWDDLDGATRANVDAIVRGEAEYMASLRVSEDPRSGGWSSNGLAGGFRNDSKIEEMGAKSMPLAVGVAHAPDDPRAAGWREWLNRWTLNLGGLPPADEANPALIDGAPVASWAQAHNVFDTFTVENHGSFAPIYQESMGAYPGRNAAHFVIAGRPIPAALRTVPNGDELWLTLDRLGTDAGVPEHLMVADRHHLYGRDVLPIAYRSVVAGDRYAARAERMLLSRLEPYVAYPPSNRLTKFSGEPKYEPEARAELAMAYLLHHGLGGAEPVSEASYFAGRSGVTDFGADVGMVAQQSPRALAAAVWKPGFTKFAWLPQHDDWLLDGAGTAPSFLPSTSLALTGRRVREYRRARDGFDASATLVRTATGFAGFTTLPTGEAVYATSGLGQDEGRLGVYNLDMLGVPGLDGDRTYSAADGAVTLAAPAGLGDGGVEDVRFETTTARWVRFLGVEPATQFGYSLFDFEVRSGEGVDLAAGAPTTASSFDPAFPAHLATDGNSGTRWAVARAERPRPDSWLGVDLGERRTFDRIRLNFEAAFGRAYRLQVSDDGASWRDVAAVPESRTFAGPWLNVDGRAGFVMRGSENPVRVTGTSVALSAGPAAGAAGMVVEARPAEPARATEAAAARPAPSGGPPALRASVAGGYLSLFNLGAEPIVGAEVTLPSRSLYRGTQRTAEGGTVYTADLDAADARVEAPRFALRGPDDLGIDVTDSHTARIENLAPRGVARFELTAIPSGEQVQVTLPAGKTRIITFHRGPRTPSADLARARTAFPTSPLPTDMTDPELTLDGDPDTAWRPGGGGRMVVDLGQSRAVGEVVLRWTYGRVRPVAVSVSDDGLTYRPVAETDGGEQVQRVPMKASGRYMAVQVAGWSDGDGQLADLAVFADAGTGSLAAATFALPDPTPAEAP